MPLRSERSPDPGWEIQSLTPLRGVAALWVVLYHYTVVYFPSIHSQDYTRFLDKGYLAVDMFFFLSGFVLAHVYRDAFVDDLGTGYWKFLFARIARIYPLHLFVLGLFIVTALTSSAFDYAVTGHFDSIPREGARSFSAFIANVFMLQGLKASELSWNYPAWSISIEFLAYLVFPFALPMIHKMHPAGKVALGIVLSGMLAGLAYWTNDDFNQWDGPKTLLRCLPEFAGGMILYGIYRRHRLLHGISFDLTFVSIASALILLLHLGVADLLIIALLPAFILAAVTNNGYAREALNTPTLMWLGQISYSLYLIHGFVQFAATNILSFSGIDREKLSLTSSVTLTVVMVLVSLSLAAMTYYAIERLGRRCLRKMFGIRSRSASTRPQAQPIPAGARSRGQF